MSSVLGIFSDFDGIPPKILNNAADRGTRVHDYCSRYALGGTILSIDDDCKPYFKSFTKWFDMLVKEVFISEERLFCDTRNLTGKLDLFCKVEGISGALVIDIKTPQQYKGGWMLQTAAYQWLLEENGYEPLKRGVLMLSNKGKIAKFVENTEYAFCKNLFSGLLRAYSFYDNLGENKYEREKECKF